MNPLKLAVAGFGVLVGAYLALALGNTATSTSADPIDVERRDVVVLRKSADGDVIVESDDDADDDGVTDDPVPAPSIAPEAGSPGAPDAATHDDVTRNDDRTGLRENDATRDVDTAPARERETRGSQTRDQATGSRGGNT